ncbi:hypothetical protein MES5069_900014 [Mesorhizobium escarrei]|uniref:Transposase n=1 Tax=Mesorhizobium escarrei TaxID=666018 RepID=A0ABN8KID1_9HYPH|nr:hypothetical protein MES5069_900014 [Mesorhizobium escarrei]
MYALLRVTQLCAYIIAKLSDARKHIREFYTKGYAHVPAKSTCLNAENAIDRYIAAHDGEAGDRKRGVAGGTDATPRQLDRPAGGAPNREELP